MNLVLLTNVLLYGLNGLEASPAIQQVHISGAFMGRIWKIFAILSFSECPISSQFDLKETEKFSRQYFHCAVFL